MIKNFKIHIIFRKTVFLIVIALTILKITTQEVEAETWEKVQTLDSTHIRVLEATPEGLLAGEFFQGTVGGSYPLNGIYISRDLGETWEFIGLKNRGITDLKYFNGIIYATTYYTINKTHGIFYSDDMGETWQNLWLSPSPTKIDRDSNTIYLGTEHYGIYTSTDEGQTWNKVFEGSGINFKIYGLQSSENITLASTISKVYKTTDKGSTWEEIYPLHNLGINSFLIDGNTIFAGSSGTKGLYVSRDMGLTWEKVLDFGSYSVDKLIKFENRYYAGRYDEEKQNYSVFVSTDGGISWENTGLNASVIDKVVSFGTIYSEPPLLFSSVSNMGIFKTEIPRTNLAFNSFLNIPWNYKNANELIDNITSFFDHSYPLLGYTYHPEPENESRSTLNFLGIKDVEPKIYYSSHGGYDFDLNFGTQIIASSSGYASYYYCKDCGNTIKINHPNGYQTTYMHLQEDDILTKAGPVWVETGDVIGKVGLTGRTTGPHLHFEVTKDRNGNGNFNDDFPTGKIDPFGWQSNEKNDPWENYSWEDTLGSHKGIESVYLWNYINGNLIRTINPGDTSNEIVLENKHALFESPIHLFTTKMLNYAKPAINSYNQILKYIENTSFTLKSFNQTGENIVNFINPVLIEIFVDPENLTGINLNSVSLYFYNEVSNIWEKVPSLFNEELNKISATVDHLSRFAVFGEKENAIPISTDIIISGSQNDIWFTEPPLIEFFVNNRENTQNINTYYSVDNGDTWQLYETPFYINTEGTTNLIYKSQDYDGLMEQEHEQTIHINLSGKTTGKIKVRDAAFQTE